MLDPSEGIALITDGSANWKDKSGGWAWVAIDAFDGIEKNSGHRGNTTIGQMELTAPTEGLSALFTAYGSCRVLVYSDSEYVVLGANNPMRKRSKNKRFWHELEHELSKHEYVEFIHVRGHNDHLYNEMADQLAGKSRREGVK